MFISPENTIPISAETLALETAKKLNLLNGQPTWNSDGTIYIDNSPQRQAEINIAIVTSKQQVNNLTEYYLQLEAQALQATRNTNVEFKNMGEYIQYLKQTEIIQITDDDNLVRIMVGFQNYLATHWNSALKQIEQKRWNITSWEEFYTPNAFRDTRWDTVTYVEELELGGRHLDKNRGILAQHIYSEDFTPYSTHTTRAHSSGIRILQEQYIDASRNNIAVSTVVTDTNSQDITFLFNSEDLLHAVPFVIGEGQSTENEIRTFFPIDIRLARSVFPSSIMQKHVPRESYHYRGYQLDSNKLIELVQ